MVAKPLLFESFRLRETLIKNRLWISPMCQYQAVNGVANNWHLIHYGALARGGAGLVIVEAAGVLPEGRITDGCLGIWNNEQVEALKPIVKNAHAAGAKIAIQLGHAGRKASTYRALPDFPAGSIPDDEGGWQSVAPSAVAFTGLREPRELNAEEITLVRDAFIEAADRAVATGFDAVEIHAAHGYLLFEFLSPLSNMREDAYGGDLAGRAKLLLEVVQGVRSNHPDLPVLVRVSASEWVENGFQPEDARELSYALKEAGADFIDVSSAGNILEAKLTIAPGYQTGFAKIVREGALPVSAVGLITQAAQAETILQTGQADVILLGREALRNPFAPIAFAKELRAENQADLVPDSYHRAWPARR